MKRNYDLLKNHAGSRYSKIQSSKIPSANLEYQTCCSTIYMLITDISDYFQTYTDTHNVGMRYYPDKIVFGEKVRDVNTTAYRSPT